MTTLATPQKPFFAFAVGQIVSNFDEQPLTRRLAGFYKKSGVTKPVILDLVLSESKICAMHFRASVFSMQFLCLNN
jgi:hypothetical protein